MAPVSLEKTCENAELHTIHIIQSGCQLLISFEFSLAPAIDHSLHLLTSAMSPQQRYNQNNDGSVADISSEAGSFDLSSSHAESAHDPNSKSSGGESSTGGATSSGNSTGNSSFELFGFTRFHFQAVSCSRWVFLGTLLVAAVGLATAVYFILHNEQVEAFEAEVRILIYALYK